MSFADFTLGVILGLLIGLGITAVYMTKPQVVVSYMNDEIIQCNMDVASLKHKIRNKSDCKIQP